MRLKYNAPVVLTFAFLSALVLVLNQTLLRGLTAAWFMAPGRGSFYAGSLRCWICLFTHVIGHANWDHLISNFSFILVIGPILESVYGSLPLLLMIIVTAVVTGAINVLFFSTALLGASGVVFMMILLASFTDFNKGELPITFILVLVLYLGQQVFDSLRADNIAHFAHIAGGLCGSLFGYFQRKKDANV
jgi:membrane associated rhomboid family serine protease